MLHVPGMRTLLVGLLSMSAACTGGSPGGGGGGDDQGTPDAAVGSPDGSMNATCPLPSSMPDMGALSALKAQRCNVNGTMGAQKWYRLSATLASGDVVQLELWPASGAFTGAVTTGTFPVETDYNTCGICVRAIGDKGAAGAKEYFGTGGCGDDHRGRRGGSPIPRRRSPARRSPR